MGEDFPNKDLVDKFVKKIIKYSDEEGEDLIGGGICCQKAW